MKPLSRFITTLTLVAGSLGTVPAAQAALTGPGPSSPVHGFPTWYQDVSGMALAPCLDQNGKCVLPPEFDPLLTSPPLLQTITTTPGATLSAANFPLEVFYWIADSVFDLPVTVSPGVTNTAKFVFRMSVEGSFVTTVAQNNQNTVFMRLNMKKMSGLVPNSTYTVSHPYGNFTFTTDGTGTTNLGIAGQGFRNQLPLGAAALDFTSVLPGVFPPTIPASPGQALAVTMDDLLVWDSGAPAGYIGDPVVGHAAVKASDFGKVGAIPRDITVSGPGLPGGSVTNGQFFIAGKKFGMGVSPASHDHGAVVIPASSTAQTVTITNENTVNALTIAAAPNGITLGGASPGDYVIGADTCSGVTLPAALPAPATPSTCTFTVTFTPQPKTPEAAVRAATININATAPAGTPSGIVNMTGTAQYPVTTGPGPHGTITGAAVASGKANAGSVQSYTITPNAKWMVKDVLVDGVAKDITAIRPSNPTQPVVFTAPALTAPQTIGATFMPSGDLDASGSLGVSDAVKAMKILIGLQAPQGDDLVAMKVAPLDTNGQPSGTGTPDLNDVLLILKRVLNIVTW